MAAYYNEIDPFASAWLKTLIDAGHIAPGDVDTRSIEDVSPDDLRPYTQCHFFAGIGVWSYALRLAGWDDERPVWTGSCPCQPFSAAGKGDGFADERHLWPAFYHLIAERSPAIVFGEKVASKAVDAWIDLVCADLEAMDYAFGALPFPSAGIGAPHIRDRGFWVADATVSGRQHREHRSEAGTECADSSGGKLEGVRLANTADAGRIGGLAYPDLHGRAEGRERQPSTGDDGLIGNCSAGGLANTGGGGGTARISEPLQWEEGITREHDDSGDQRDGAEAAPAAAWPGPTNGFWRDTDWLFCRDGKWRPVEPGTFPLAHGTAARVGRLRGYGNAINAEAARAFIESVI